MSPRGTNDTIAPRCGVLETIELLGGRYKLLILRALLFADAPLRFGELRRETQDISQKTLTRNLRDLETSGLLTRKVYPEVPPRVEYSLTATGRALMPVFKAMESWAGRHLDLR
jgi:DNA-binding HxlR family transcriptional regulator